MTRDEMLAAAEWYAKGMQSLSETPAADPPDWEQRYRTLEAIAEKRLAEMMRLIEENDELRRKLACSR